MLLLMRCLHNKLMDKPTNLIELKASIILLEIKQKKDALKLKEQCLLTYEQFKPMNLIKGTFHDLVQAPDFQGDLLDASLSIATGYSYSNGYNKSCS
jgi:hypothetical protein